MKCGLWTAECEIKKTSVLHCLIANCAFRPPRL